jgi:quercetin dioxygenase-like cupin family protein
MSGHFIKPQTTAQFNPAKYTKQDLCSGDHLFVGLNCFEPGQVQGVHSHSGADKFYYIISGRATISVGAESREVQGGELVWAPADIPHGVPSVAERTVMLVGIAPAPNHK